MMAENFPVECSILSSNALCEHILPEYALSGLRRCQLQQHGDNDTYLVHHEQRKYILRVWSKNTRPLQELEAEMELLALLAEQHVPVAQPLKRADGTNLSAVSAPDGERMIGLFCFAAGTAPGKQITPVQSHAHGRAVATMHQAFDTLMDHYQRPVLNIEHLLDASMVAILSWLADRSADALYLTQLAKILAPHALTVPKTPPLYELCHGDLHKTNLLWTDDAQLTILDFDLCGDGWRIYDLAVLFWSTRYLPQAQMVREGYVDGYNSLKPLQPIELDALPYFVAIRDIFIMAAELGHACRGVSGSNPITGAFFDEHFGFIHRWMDAIKDRTFYTL